MPACPTGAGLTRVSFGPTGDRDLCRGPRYRRASAQLVRRSGEVDGVEFGRTAGVVSGDHVAPGDFALHIEDDVARGVDPLGRAERLRQEPDFAGRAVVEADLRVRVGSV